MRKELKLTELAQRELEKREMNKISGKGTDACCVCANGETNHKANQAGGLHSPSMVGTYTEVAS